MLLAKKSLGIGHKKLASGLVELENFLEKVVTHAQLD